MVSDQFNLQRFVDAQETTYATAYKEISSGKKRTHWMWFIFPQFEGLGFSATFRLYAIKSLAEAKEYLEHPVLGPRLRECCEALLRVEGCTAHQIFGDPDDVKLKSSMALFSYVSDPDSPFQKVLDHYFDGNTDQKTLELITRSRS